MLSDTSTSPALVMVATAAACGAVVGCYSCTCFGDNKTNVRAERLDACPKGAVSCLKGLARNPPLLRGLRAPATHGHRR